MRNLSRRHSRKSKALLAKVKYGVVLADKDVAKNPQRAVRGGDVDTGHTKEANRVLVVDDVVCRLDCVPVVPGKQ